MAMQAGHWELGATTRAAPLAACELCKGWTCPACPLMKRNANKHATAVRFFEIDFLNVSGTLNIRC